VPGPNEAGGVVLDGIEPFELGEWEIIYEGDSSSIVSGQATFKESDFSRQRGIHPRSFS
jgi:hypothetical protein